MKKNKHGIYLRNHPPGHTQKINRLEGQISKKALVAFISGAGIVFSVAIYYCVTTNYAVVGGVLAGAFGLIGIFALSVYKSFK